MVFIEELLKKGKFDDRELFINKLKNNNKSLSPASSSRPKSSSGVINLFQSWETPQWV